MIDIRIQSFIKVVECKNYTQAARELHLTQPAVSQHIQSLQNEYNVLFIQNKNKQFSLTKAGQRFYDYALMQVRNEEIFKLQLTKEAKILHIGSTLSIADSFLPSLITPLLNNEDHYFKISVGNTKRLTNLLLEGKIDCAFIEGQIDADLFEHQLFRTDDFVLVGNIHHPLLKEKDITFDKLLSYPLLLREEGSGSRTILEDYLRQGIYSIHSFEQVNELGSISMIKKILANSHAITFMYKEVIKDELDDYLTIIPLSNFHLTHDLYFIYPKNSIAKDDYLRFYSLITK